MLPAAEQEYATLLSAVVHRLVPVDQPLVLITQAPRSGGTLLMRLFDGHPACHAIPHELSTLLPTSLPLPREADRAWKVLDHPMLETWFVGGLRAGKGQLSGDSDAVPVPAAAPHPPQGFRTRARRARTTFGPRRARRLPDLLLQRLARLPARRPHPAG